MAQLSGVRPHRLSAASVALICSGALFALGPAPFGCGTTWLSEEDFLPASRPSYKDDIAPLLAEKCVSCHDAPHAAGNYHLSSWRGLFGGGTNAQRNVIAGDPQSTLLQVLTARSDHQGLLSAAESERLRAWVVDAKLAYFSSTDAGYHRRGWLDPSKRSDPAFHGGYLRAARWDMTPCKRCHGEDFKGGKSKVSCESCHKGGPLSCTTCHGDGLADRPNPPGDLLGNLQTGAGGVGLHRLHTASTQAQPVACSECHRVPTEIFAPGHLFDADNQSDMRAEVAFGELARGRPLGLDLKPHYDAETRTCTNVYCHTLDGGSLRSWVWNKPQGEVTCGSCHGYPPGRTSSGKTHADAALCEACHLGAYQNGKREPKTHINGKIEAY